MLWYCDLRGFTRASDRLPRDAIIALLNDYFSIMGGAVTGAGGEILKFMGDGMLAMLPIASADRARRTAARAPRGRRVAAQRMIAALNLMRDTAESPRCVSGWRCMSARSCSAISAPAQRLDFTVIGPAVNHAARLEKLCGPLDRPIVCLRRWPPCCPSAKSCRSAVMP